MIIKASYFMANFWGKVKTVIHELSRSNAAAVNIAGEYSWGKWEIG